MLTWNEKLEILHSIDGSLAYCSQARNNSKNFSIDYKQKYHVPKCATSEHEYKGLRTLLQRHLAAVLVTLIIK